MLAMFFVLVFLATYFALAARTGIFDVETEDGLGISGVAAAEVGVAVVVNFAGGEGVGIFDGYEVDLGNDDEDFDDAKAGGGEIGDA